MLLRAQAAAAVERLAKNLSKDDAGRAKLLAERLGEDGRLTVGAAHAALSPAESPTTANKRLLRLIQAVNAAAARSGLPLKLAITADKKLGLARHVWFEGPGEERRARSDALDAIEAPGASRTLVSDVRAIELSEPKILLVTFNEHEERAVKVAFADLGPPRRIDDGVWELGSLFGTTIVHGHSLFKRGQGQTEAMALAARLIKPGVTAAIVGVGIACGLTPTPGVGQKIGDVLVADKSRDVALTKREKNNSETIRSEDLPASRRWVRRFAGLDPSPSPGAPLIHVGPFLCGNILLNNASERKNLIDFDQRRTANDPAVGYEMESYAIAKAAAEAEVAWIVVKGVSDWGEGKKDDGKQARQILAARNAAQLVRRALDLGPVGETSGQAPGRPSGRSDLARQSASLRAGAFAPHRNLSAMGKGELAEDAQGAPLSLRPGDGAAERTRGVAIMGALREWADDSGAPPLFALLGEYGMGKTVTCERCDRDLRARREKDLGVRESFLFNLKDLTLKGDAVPTLAETVEECFARGWVGARRGELTLDDLLLKMSRGAVVIFDGLDEILVRLTGASGQTFTQGLLRLVADYRARFPQGASPRLLLSCRTQYFRSLEAQRGHFLEQDRGGATPDAYRAFELLPFTKKQIADYLARSLPGEDTTRLMAAIGAVHDLEELAGRPYTLKLIRDAVPQIKLDLDAGRPIHAVGLYRMMAREWLKRDMGKSHIRPEDKLSLIAHLAAHLWRGGVSAIAVAALEDWLHVWIAERPALAARYAKLHPDQLEEDLRTATFLARQDGDDPANGRFRFAHTSLQEFFLADYLLTAAREGAPERWAIPAPSVETLDFLGQMLRHEDDAPALAAMRAWRREARPAVNALLLAYALRAKTKGWPRLPLDGIDLSGLDYAQAKFADVDLGGAKFVGARLNNSEFARANLARADFGDAKAAMATFDGCDLRGAALDGAEFSGAAFHRCRLGGASVEGAMGFGAQFLLSEGHAALEARLSNTLNSNVQIPPGARLDWASGHGGPVNACAFAPDGQTILSASIDKSLKIWDAKSGAAIMTLNGHTNWVNACAFAPDGQTILSASHDKSLKIWDAKSGAAIMTLNGHAGAVRACAFAPDGQTILSASADNALKIWDAKSGAEIMTLDGHADAVWACAFAPDGRTILSASADNALKIWDAKSGAEIMTLNGHTGTVLACAFAPDGRTILSASADKSLKIWDAKSGAEIMTLNGHTGYVLACAFAPDGRTLLSASDDTSLRIWDAKSGAEIMTLNGHRGPVIACAFAPDGRTILSASRDNSLKIWDAKSGVEIMTLNGHADWVRACAFAPDGRTILSASYDNSLRIWDATSGAALRIHALTDAGGWAVWAPGENRLIEAAGDAWRYLRWRAPGSGALFPLEAAGDVCREAGAGRR